MESPAQRRRRRRRIPDADRKRAPRACDRCKARKNKCVETDSGVCVRCIAGSHPCRFDRERSPVEDGVEDRPKMAAPTTSATTSTTTSMGVAATVDDHEGRTEDRTTLGQSIKTDFSPAVSSPSEAFMWPRFLSRLREAFCLDSQPAPEEQDMMRLQARLSRPTAVDPAELRRVKKAVSRFPPQGVAEFLVSVCIAYGTDVFFYFDQAQFTSELHQFYSDDASPLRMDTSFVCLALAVFALGSQWTALARPGDLSDESVPDDFDPGRIFYNQARILMSDLIDRPCIRSVQATFILGVYLMPASAISASYVYMGLALRKALAIGLHQEPDDPSFDEDEREMRRRLWWSVYSLERTVTIKLNRPRSVSQGIITARLPRPTPSDASQKFDNIQHQIANATFVGIIDKLSEPGAWLNISQAPLAQSGPTKIGQASLKQWKKALPSSLKLKNVNPKSSSYRAVFHLHLNYYFAWIDMGKVSVVTVVRARLRGVFCPDEELPTVGNDVEASSEACVKAARKMLELFDGLSRGGNMARFSFTDFQGCSIATIIVLLAGILDRDSGYEGRVAFGLDSLRKMSCGGNVTARMGVRFVEALQSITNEARAKLLAVQRQQESRESISSAGEDGYGRWAQWLANAEVPGCLSADSSESEQSEEPPTAVPDAAVVPNIMLPSPWEETAALQLQEMSASGFGLPMEETGDLIPAVGHTLMPLPPGYDSWLPSGAWNDDQMYLMGLAGMDVLDFTSGL